MMDIIVKAKGIENAKSVPGHRLFIVIFLLIFLPFILHSIYSAPWGRLHFSTFMCYINYKFICYANIPSSYYCQFAVKINFENSVTAYIILLCTTITRIYSSSMFAC